MTVRGALTYCGKLGQRTISRFTVKLHGMAGRRLTDGTGTQAGSLLHKAVQIRHLLIHGAEWGLSVLYSFSSQSVLVL